MTRVLIVEDESIAAMYLQESLESLGYDVPESAADYQQAINFAEQYQPDIILMDINLNSKLSGIEAAKNIYEKYSIPVIFITAFSDSQTINKAKSAGAFAYMIKPVEIKSLQSSIEMILEKHRAENSLKSNEWLSTAITNIHESLIALDNKLKVRFISNDLLSLLKLDINSLVNRNLEDTINIINNQTGEKLSETIKSYQDIDYQGTLVNNDLFLPVTFSITEINNSIQDKFGFFVYIKVNKPGSTSDITDELSDIIRICSICKKVHSNNQLWVELESYIQEKLGISFSHGLCTDCRQNYYPEN